MCTRRREGPFDVVTACAELGPLAGFDFHFLVRPAPMNGGHLDREDQTIKTQLHLVERPTQLYVVERPSGERAR